jgi:hypothetical protein
LRRLEAAIDKDPALTMERRGISKGLLRAVIDDMGLLAHVSDNDGIADVPGQNRRERHAVGTYRNRTEAAPSPMTVPPPPEPPKASARKSVSRIVNGKKQQNRNRANAATR